MNHVDPVQITQKVISGVYGGVTTVQLDDLVRTIPSQSLLPPLLSFCLVLTTTSSSLPGR